LPKEENRTETVEDGHVISNFRRGTGRGILAYFCKKAMGATGKAKGDCLYGLFDDR
jgi:hypothetical protein